MSSKDEKPLAEAMNTTSSSENPEQEKTKSTEPTASTTTNTTTVASDEKEQTKKWEADPWAAFVKGVKVAFKTWDAMQLAIKEQFVLRAEEKAKGIEADVLNLFLGRSTSSIVCLSCLSLEFVFYFSSTLHHILYSHLLFLLVRIQGKYRRCHRLNPHSHVTRSVH